MSNEHSKLSNVAAVLVDQKIPFTFKPNGEIVANKVRVFIDVDGSLVATQFKDGCGIKITLEEIVRYIKDGE